MSDSARAEVFTLSSVVPPGTSRSRSAVSRETCSLPLTTMAVAPKSGELTTKMPPTTRTRTSAIPDNERLARGQGAEHAARAAEHTGEGGRVLLARLALPGRGGRGDARGGGAARLGDLAGAGRRLGAGGLGLGRGRCRRREGALRGGTGSGRRATEARALRAAADLVEMVLTRAGRGAGTAGRGARGAFAAEVGFEEPAARRKVDSEIARSPRSRGT